MRRLSKHIRSPPFRAAPALLTNKAVVSGRCLADPQSEVQIRVAELPVFVDFYMNYKNNRLPMKWVRIESYKESNRLLS